MLTPDGDWKPVTSADFLGHVVILEFWATWCAPCRPAAVHLKELLEQYEDQGLRVLGIAHEDKETVVRFLKRNALGFPIALDRGDAMHRALGVRAFPTAVLLDRFGKLAWKGSPSRLTAPVIDEYLKNGTLPDFQKIARTRKKAASPDRGLKITVDIVPEESEECGSSFGYSQSDHKIDITFSRKSAVDILRHVLNVSPQRFRMDAPALEMMYTGEIKLFCAESPVDNMNLALADVVASSMRLRLERRTENTQVLVLKQSEQTPEVAIGLPKITKSGESGVRHLPGVKVSGILGLSEFLEEDFSRVVIDETQLPKRYKFRYTVKEGQELDLDRLSKELGLLVTLEEREVEITHARREKK